MPDEISIGGVCRLADRGVIRASGADAATFLQGQLTNDVREPGRGIGAPGRLLLGEGPAAGELHRLAAGRRRVPALVPDRRSRADAQAPVDVRPARQVQAERRERRDRAVRRRRAGRDGDAGRCRRLATRAARAAPRRSACPTPPACSAPSSLRPSAPRSTSAAAPAMTLATWRWLEVESGIVTIEAATVDRFVPQMVNFELVGGVDFQKGCYPGQEVVARSQYRGTTKRRTLLFDCDSVPTEGQDVFVAGAVNEPAGTVANAAPHPEHRGGSALVEVRLAALRRRPSPRRRRRTAASPARAALPRAARRHRAGLSGRDGRARALRLVSRAARARRRSARRCPRPAAIACAASSPACRRASSFATRARRRPGWKRIRSRREALATTAGIDAAIEAAIAAAASPLEGLIDGPRHVEAFAVVA